MNIWWKHWKPLGHRGAIPEVWYNIFWKQKNVKNQSTTVDWNYINEWMSDKKLRTIIKAEV